MNLSLSEPPSRRTAKGGKSPRVLVIYNPAAGQWRKRRLQTTLAALKGLGCTITLFATQKAGDAQERAATLSREDCDVVVAAGGDGTINEVANGLANAQHAVPPLAIIPLGTANVLAQEIGLRGNPRAVARAIAQGGRMTVHLGDANGRYFLMMAGVGFDAHVVANVDLALKRRTGKLAYVVETLIQGLRYGFPRCRVTVDGQSHDAYSVVVCNGRHYGGPFVAAPKASLAEPAFEVCLLKKGGYRHVLRYGAALVMGRLSALPDVEILTGKSLRIEGDPGLPVQGDGDIIATLPVQISVAERTLELVIP
jgi:YegS/Rv2252/BmrU family lipid kinase